jgi:hypothetical protein
VADHLAGRHRPPPADIVVEVRVVIRVAVVALHERVLRLDEHHVGVGIERFGELTPPYPPPMTTTVG